MFIKFFKLILITFCILLFFNCSKSNEQSLIDIVKKDDYKKFILYPNLDSIINLYDEEGNTLLHIASLYGSKMIAELLIKKGISVNIKNINSETPLSYACMNGHFKLV